MLKWPRRMLRRVFKPFMRVRLKRGMHHIFGCSILPSIVLFWLLASPAAADPQSRGICIRVIDGDTIEIIIDSRPETVRLIGVDTPETKHPSKPVQYFGLEATAFARKIAEGKKVSLAYDQTLRDRYRRLLAYVYLDDGTFLNAEIIKQGYGFAYLKYPFKYMEEFRQHEREARENKRGMWGRQWDQNQ